MTSKKINIGAFLTSTGNFIKNNPKPLLYVGGSIALVVIGATLVKRVSKKITGEDIKGGKDNKLSVDETKTTISKETAKNYAESLFEAFNYVWGTDKEVIEQVFSKINSEDFKLIFNAFGLRSYSELNGGTPSGMLLAPDTWIGYNNVNLISWLNSELGVGDSTLREKVRKVVEPAGFILEK